MFEKLKELFCIHKFIPVSSVIIPEGKLIHLCCEKCGRAKAVVSKIDG